MLRTAGIVMCAMLCATACTSSGASAPPGTSATTATAPTSRVPLTTAQHPTASRTSAATHSASASRTTAPRPTTLAQRDLAAMTEAERVGQLFMVDCPSSGVRQATITAIRQHHVGSVILDGNSTLGVTRTHQIAVQLQRLAPKGVGLFIATDQEGGLVQRMRGPGFSSIPSALTQGGQAPATLRAHAKTWARQLRAAGIRVDLAPVLGTVPANGADNPPIGDLDREYGHTPAAVTAHGVAVAKGLADGYVDATVKHFPGLGRVSQNTDTTSGVTDRVTTRHDAYLAPFAAAIKAGAPFVMMSTAIYARIAPNRPAAFSRIIVSGMLRHDLGFHGVIITDDVGAAVQVRGYTPAQRAVDVITAGGTMVLTVDPGVIAAMTAALLAKAASDPAFRKLIDAAALTVLNAKQARGLLT